MGGGGRGDVGGGGDRAVELDAQVVAVALDAGDGGRPGVAGAAVGLVRVQGDGGGRERDERVAVERVGDGEGEAVGDVRRCGRRRVPR